MMMQTSGMFVLREGFCSSLQAKRSNASLRLRRYGSLRFARNDEFGELLAPPLYPIFQRMLHCINHRLHHPVIIARKHRRRRTPAPVIDDGQNDIQGSDNDA
jgi:hypothetical protein